jgi:hypothetical protein
MRQTRFLPLLLVLLLPLTACGKDDPVGPDPKGTLSFTYSGDISGTFSASGEPKPDAGDFPQTEFAAAQAENGNVLIIGLRPTQQPKFDYFGIALEGVTSPKTVQVCAQPTGGACPAVFYLRGFNGNGDTFDQAYVFTSGSVTISEINAERVRGSFQGTAIFISGSGQPSFGRTITVTNGQFDVPVRNDLDWDD